MADSRTPTEPTRSDADRWQPLAAQLTSTANRTRSLIREARTRRAALRALDPVTLVAMIAVPVALLLWVIASRVTGLHLPLPPLWGTVGLCLAIPAAFVGIRAAKASARPVDDRNALAVADAQLGLEDRLITAAEFIEEPQRSGFMEAALEDAVEAAKHAETAELNAASVGSAGQRWLAIAGSLLACALTIFAVYSWGPAAFSTDPELALKEADPPRDFDQPEEPRKVDDLPTPTSKPKELPSSPKTGVQPPLSGTSEPQARPGALTEDTKKTRGQTGPGSSANASSSSGSSESRDSPSAQGPSSLEPQKKSTKKPKPPKKRETRPAEEGERKKPERKSGATAGKGMASGSTKSPDASEWSSKDQVVSEDEADLDSDEEVDDEFDDQDSRGGVQPQLRDRKPPVNRDLSIGFGNQKNPDANGRGGQSEQKKSRGVATLVLGVSIPDHVKGRPNPGKTKVTQERVEPRRENAPSLTANPRTAREAPVGEITQPELAPWMRRYLRDYYLSLRTQNAKE